MAGLLHDAMPTNCACVYETFSAYFPSTCVYTISPRYDPGLAPPSALIVPQHPDEERYNFAAPSTMKPTQVSCAEGSVNQIPAWTEMRGDIRLTPFYDIDDCIEKVKGYVKELNDGESCD